MAKKKAEKKSTQRSTKRATGKPVFALKELTFAEEAMIGALVKKAAS